ncbi:MAG: glycosyltransferase [Pseudomonadota bacterium]|nr:glycosyltransferase [Pseudomonadota bacterium]
MTDSSAPAVAVLLATYNGESWLQQQIDTIHAQEGVRVHIVASDDSSTDTTPEILLRYAANSPLLCLPQASARMGNANRNFLRLVFEAPLGDVHFVAFSDQDDIWHAAKLARAIAELARTGAHAYSSNVKAFWPDGRTRVLVKSQPQRRHDHLFESAGPGCTFVFTREAFERLQSWVRSDYARLCESPVHDWLIYAFARVQGWRWHIDDAALMDYRQHGLNEVGANVGSNAALRRLGLLQDGRFRRNAIQVASLVDDASWVSRSLRRLTLMDRLRLALAFRSLRRRWRDALMMIYFLLTTK